MSDSAQQRAAELRARGHDEIAHELGVSKTTVYRWLNPEYARRHRNASRNWKARNRDRVRRYDAQTAHKLCPHCNQPRKRQSRVCYGCRRAVEDARRSAIEGVWHDGWSLAEIADTLHCSTGGRARECDVADSRG